MRVRRHGALHVGAATDLLLPGLSLAFNVFACPVGWQRGGERGGTIDCCNVYIRVGTKLHPSGLIARCFAYLSGSSSLSDNRHASERFWHDRWLAQSTSEMVIPRPKVSTPNAIPEMIYDKGLSPGHPPAVTPTTFWPGIPSPEVCACVSHHQVPGKQPVSALLCRSSPSSVADWVGLLGLEVIVVLCSVLLRRI